MWQIRLGIFVGRNDISFSVKIEENRLRVVKFEKKNEVQEAEDLKQIFHA
jgi:hypothetical protein